MKNIWILLLLPLLANADTSQNLIINGTFDNGTTGWTLSGDAQRINDCCPGGHDLEFGNNGSIEQSFNLIHDSITQQMLDNGIVLNSSVEIQNGESVGGWCANCGPVDSFSIQLDILDENSQVLATTIQERTNVTGINGKDFTDSVTHTGTGSNIGRIVISGSDGSTGYLGGPNVDNVSVTMEYDPIVLSLEQTEHIAAVSEIIEEIYIEEFIYEEPIIEEVVFEEPTVEIVEEPISIEEEFIEETIVLAPAMIEPEPIEEEIYEEEIVETIEETITNSEVDEDTTGTVATEPTTEISSEPQDNSGSLETELTIEEISVKVAEKIKTIDGQLKATQMIVAKVMQNNSKITGYTQVNTDIFIQPNIVDTDISAYTINTYSDIRNIYPNQTYEDRLWTSRQ